MLTILALLFSTPLFAQGVQYGSVQTQLTTNTALLGVIVSAVSAQGNLVTAVTASPPLASSGGTTPNVTFTGTLAGTSGGTGKASWTAKSIPFANATNGLTEDVAFPFTYDSTNRRLNLGTAGTGKLNVTAAGGSDLGINIFSTASNNAAQIQNQSAYSLSLINAAGSATAGASLGGAFSRGTLASRTQSLAGDQIFSITGQGYTGSAFGPGFSGAIGIVATENTTSTHNGAQIYLAPTPNGALTPVVALTVDQDGSVISAKGYRLATAGSQPTCSSGIRGTVWNLQGAAGVADVLQVCQKKSDDTYAWVTH